jgi:acetyltransferase
MSEPYTPGSTARRTSADAPRGEWTWRLYDGTPIQLRTIGPEDAKLELEFLNRLSPEMRSLRFLGLIKEPCPDVARELTVLDPARAVGFAAVVLAGGRERQVGAAHLRANAAGDHCDCSVAVSDEWRRRGIGSALMHLLIDAARRRGIRHMHAFAPAQADDGHHLAARLGFQRGPDRHDPAVVVYHLDL